MDFTSVSQKIPRPTVTLAAFALLIDCTAIQRVGISPAYLSIDEALKLLSLDFAYLSIILVLAALPAALGSVLAVLSLNYVVFVAFRRATPRVRMLSVAAKYGRRKDYVPIEKVRHYAVENRDKALLESIAKHDNSLSIETSFMPSVVLVLLTYLVVVSSVDHPNFLMKVCSLNAPVELCWRYPAVLVLAYFQALSMMAISGWTFARSALFPRKNLTTDWEVISDYCKQHPKKDFAYAVTNWMRHKKQRA